MPRFTIRNPCPASDHSAVVAEAFFEVEFVSNERCFVQASEDPEIHNRLQSCGIAVDPSNPTTTCNNALSDASCVRNIYEGYCGSQLAHGMCQTRVSFVKRLEVVDENCLAEMRTRCTSSAAYITVSKLIVTVIILLIYTV
ncbi:hypothetical protein Tcan_13370 [Toxocara canis]|uniref:DUF19 domain-containing protein n=1 Tax=Toxocara canis TaxID=6265 RepID=A0A0B2V7L7_TOXCA|nr:hypothetical protein Tcan_13370 [Toxocara canis]